MLKQVLGEETILFADGVARNPCVHGLLEEVRGTRTKDYST